MSRKKIGVYKKMKRRYIFDKKVLQFLIQTIFEHGKFFN